MSNGGDLSRTQALRRKFREIAQLGTKRRAGMLEFLREPLIESFRPMKAEDRSAARVRFQQACEAGFDAGALVLERQRASWRGQVVRDAFAVLRGLQFDSGEGLAFLLGLDDSDRSAVHEQQVVSLAMPRLERELADSYATSGGQVRSPLVLSYPASFRQELVDVLPGPIFRSSRHVSRRLYLFTFCVAPDGGHRGNGEAST